MVTQGKIENTQAATKTNSDLEAQNVAKVKKILQDPLKTNTILDSEALAKSLKISKSHTEKTLILISDTTPRVALNFVLQPFVTRFGLFARYHCKSLMRWPRVSEVSNMLKAYFDTSLSPTFIEKRSKSYTVRKLIAENPQWDAVLSNSRGALPKYATIKNYDELVSEFKDYLLKLRQGDSPQKSKETSETSPLPTSESELLEEKRRQEENLLEFGVYVLKQVGITSEITSRTLAESLLELFEMGNP